MDYKVLIYTHKLSYTAELKSKNQVHGIMIGITNATRLSNLKMTYNAHIEPANCIIKTS